MAERRLYAKFTLDYADSHKIAPLSDAAFRAHVRMVLWARRMLTDGKIPGPMAKVFAKPRILQELTTNDPVNPSLVKVGDDYWLHDFTEHQSTKEEVLAQQERNRTNGQAGGIAKAKRVASKSVSEIQAKLYTETETETTSSTKKREPANRGSRLSADWMPTTESIAVARQDAPGVDHKAEHKTFIDYWIAQPGQKGVKTNWDAVWRNWMRRKASDLTQRKPTPEQRLQQTVQLATAIDLRGIDQ